jgi:hypothetical protein
MSEPPRQARARGAEPRTLLEEGCQQLGLSLLASQLDDLMKYAHVLIKWRRVYNLVGARSLSEVITHHLLDSLSVNTPCRRCGCGTSRSYASGRKTIIHHNGSIA